MELDLPYGPWVRLVYGQWGKYPVALFQNPDKLLMLVLFEKKGDQVTGMVMMLKRVFVVDGELGKFMQAQKREVTLVEKFSKDYSGRYLVISSTPVYARYTQDELIENVKKHYLELDGLAKITLEMAAGYGFKIRDLSKASEEEAQLFLGDPLSLFSYSVAGGAPGAAGEAALKIPRFQLGVNKEGEEYELKMDSLFAVCVVGGARSNRLHVVHVLCEAALYNGVPVMVFDSSGAFKGLALPNNDSSKYAQFKLAGSPAGFPFKGFVLGENLFIDLGNTDSNLFLKTFGLEKTEFASIIKAVHSQIKGSASSLGDLASALNNLKESKDMLLFNIKRASRCIQVIQKVYPSLFNKVISQDLTQPWHDATGRACHVDLSRYPIEVQKLAINTLLQGIVIPPTASLQLLLAFEPDASALAEEIAFALDKFKKQGVGIAVNVEHELDFKQLGDMEAVIEVINDEAVAKEKGEKQARFSVRPTYSLCTENAPPAPKEKPVEVVEARKAPLEVLHLPFAKPEVEAKTSQQQPAPEKPAPQEALRGRWRMRS